MMSTEVRKLASMKARVARLRIGPLLAALLVILSANAAVFGWRYLEKAETRRTFEKLKQEAKTLAIEVSALETRIEDLQRGLESKRLLIEKLDGEIGKGGKIRRLEAVARRETAARAYNFMADDYRKIFKEYEGKFSELKSRYGTLNRLAEDLGLNESFP